MNHEEHEVKDQEKATRNPPESCLASGAWRLLS